MAIVLTTPHNGAPSAKLPATDLAAERVSAAPNRRFWSLSAHTLYKLACALRLPALALLDDDVEYWAMVRRRVVTRLDDGQGLGSYRLLPAMRQ